MGCFSRFSAILVVNTSFHAIFEFVRAWDIVFAPCSRSKSLIRSKTTISLRIILVRSFFSIVSISINMFSIKNFISFHRHSLFLFYFIDRTFVRNILISWTRDDVISHLDFFLLLRSPFFIIIVQTKFLKASIWALQTNDIRHDEVFCSILDVVVYVNFIIIFHESNLPLSWQREKDEWNKLKTLRMFLFPIHSWNSTSKFKSHNSFFFSKLPDLTHLIHLPLSCRPVTFDENIFRSIIFQTHHPFHRNGSSLF